MHLVFILREVVLLDNEERTDYMGWWKMQKWKS